MRIHQIPAQAAFERLKSGPDGLSEAQSATRRQEFGPNRIERIQRTPLVIRFLAQFTHFFAVLLWMAALLAWISEIQMPGQGMATLAAAIVCVIVINGGFAFWQEYRAEETIVALQRLLPRQVNVRREGAIAVIPLEEVVPGDVIFLTAGDDVPADCRLIEAFGVRVSTAALTGEAQPLSRDARPDTEADLLQNRNVLLAGTSLTAGQARALVFATGMHTAFGRIANLTQRTRDTPSPLQTEISALSRLIAALSIALGLSVFAVGWFIDLPVRVCLVFAIGIIVANVPEGLLPTVTLAMALAARRMAERHTLVRHLPAVETLGSASVICTDKTGTLTENRMEVSSIYVGRFLDASAVRTPGFAATHRRFLQCAAHCHDLKMTGKGNDARWIGDPMELTLMSMANGAGDEPAFPLIDEIPFDPDRKRLVTVHNGNSEIVLFTKGAPEEVLPRALWRDVDGHRELLTGDSSKAFTDAAVQMADRGLRVLAFAYRVLPTGYSLADVEQELVVTAIVGFRDPPRPEVPAAVRRCRDAGVRVIMVTGDHPSTALAVAREIGLVHSAVPRVLTGHEVGKMSDVELRLALDEPEIICARMSADQKLQLVTALQSKKEIVAVTGDGVNDAPALRAADIGIAMGISGTEVAREAADMVLLDDNFASIVTAIDEGRAIYANIRKFLTYILTSNVAEFVPYLAFAFARLPLALTVIQILAVDLGTDMLPALGLGAEPPDSAHTMHPAHQTRDRLLSRSLLVRAYLFLGVLEAAAAMTAFLFVLIKGGWRWPQSLLPEDLLYRQATTACLTAIVLMQVVNVQLCRSRTTSLLALRPLGNRLIAAGVAVEIVLLLVIDYTLAGNRVFGTVPLGWDVWLLIVPLAAAMLILEELVKWMRRRGSRRGMLTK